MRIRSVSDGSNKHHNGMKTMNIDLTFRFVTRTLSEDYRVFGNGGRETYSDSSEFEPLRKKGRIIPEEGACAVLWEESSNIFLIVSAMQRGVNDFANRPIRFSFCEIFTERVEAWTAFTRIISEFSEAERVMQSLILEKPRPGGEDVEFRQEEFTAWLQEHRRSGLTFSVCREGDVITRDGDAWPDMWPPEGTMFRWRNTEDDEISCERISDSQPGVSKRKPERHEEVYPSLDERKKLPKWAIPAVCGAAAAAIIIAGICFVLH